MNVPTGIFSQRTSSCEPEEGTGVVSPDGGVVTGGAPGCGGFGSVTGDLGGGEPPGGVSVLGAGGDSVPRSVSGGRSVPPEADDEAGGRSALRHNHIPLNNATKMSTSIALRRNKSKPPVSR